MSYKFKIDDLVIPTRLYSSPQGVNSAAEKTKYFGRVATIAYIDTAAAFCYALKFDPPPPHNEIFWWRDEELEPAMLTGNGAPPSTGQAGFSALKCICELNKLMAYGCQCGAFKQEKQLHALHRILG